MKKIAPNFFLSNKLPPCIKKFLDKNDTINQVTVLTTLSSYIDHLPHIDQFSINNRTLETGVDLTCLGSWMVKDGQDFVLSIYRKGEIETPLKLCDNGPKFKKEITDGGNRTRTLDYWENDMFRLPKKAKVKFKNKTYDLGGLTYSEILVKYKQLNTARYEKATVTIKIEYGLSNEQKANSFLNTNKQKPVKNHEKLFVEPTELIKRLRNLSKHMPLFETVLINGKRVPLYINLTDKNLEAPKNMLKLFAYMHSKHADERDVESIKINRTKLESFAKTCNLSTEKDRMSWKKMCGIVEQIQSIYDAAPTTKYDPHLSDKSQSDSTTSRYFNIMFVVLDNFEYLFGSGATISNKKQFQAAMVEMFMTLDRDVIEGMDEAVFKRHTRKLFDPVPDGAPIKSRLQEVLYMIAQYVSKSSMTMFGIVHKDPNRCFPRALIDMKFAQQGFKCGVTHQSIPRSDAVGAHIIPHCKGGPTTYDNLIVVSTQINRDMGDMTLQEYLDMKQMYVCN